MTLGSRTLSECRFYLLLVTKNCGHYLLNYKINNVCDCTVSESRSRSNKQWLFRQLFFTLTQLKNHVDVSMKKM